MPFPRGNTSREAVREREKRDFPFPRSRRFCDCSLIGFRYDKVFPTMNTNTPSICACPNCRKQFSVNDDYFGQTITCDACGTSFVVPDTAQENRGSETSRQTELLAQILRAQSETNEHLKALSKQILLVRAHTREAATWISFFGILTVISLILCCAGFLFGCVPGGVGAVIFGSIIALVGAAILFAFYCWALKRVDNIDALSQR